MSEKKSYIKYINDDVKNLNILIKENLFGLLTIILFTIAGYIIGSFVEDTDTEKTISKLEISFVSNEDILSQAKYSSFKTSINNIYNLPHSTKIVLAQNVLESDHFSRFFFNLKLASFEKILSSSIKSENELKNNNFSSEEIKIIKSIEISKTDLQKELYEISSPHINKISNNEFYEKFKSLIRNRILSNFQQSAHILYNERNNSLLTYKDQFEARQKDYIEEGLRAKSRQKLNILNLIDQQINIASSLNISEPHKSIEQYQPSCSLNNSEGLTSLGQCFLYGKKYLEKEREFIESLDINSVNQTYDRLSQAITDLKGMTANDYIQDRKLLIDSIILKYQDLLSPDLKIKSKKNKIKKEVIFDRRFITSLFFIMSSITIFFLTIIKYQRRKI